MDNVNGTTRMNFRIEWYRPKRAIYVQYGALLDQETIQASAQKMYEMAQSVPDCPVHTIIDLSQTQGFTLKLLELRAFLDKMLVSYPPNGWTILLGEEHSRVLFTAGTMARFFRIRFRSVKTLAEADHFLDHLAKSVVVN